MSFLHELKLQWLPPRIDDADFGRLRFIYIANHPERSYWEAIWKFPPTGTAVDISLPGNEGGPLPESKDFYLRLAERFDKIMVLCRPHLEKVIEDWLEQKLP